MDFLPKLAAAGVRRSPREVLPPADPAAVENSRKLLSAIAELGQLSATHPLFFGHDYLKEAGPNTAIPAFSEPAPRLSGGIRAAPSMSWEDLRAQLQQAENILAEARSILQAPVAPTFDSDAPISSVDVDLYRLLMMLDTDVGLQLREGRPGKAIDDIEAMRKITAMSAQSGDTTRVAIELIRYSRNVLPAVWTVLQHPDLTDTDLQRIQRIVSDQEFAAHILNGLELQMLNMPVFVSNTSAAAASGASIFPYRGSLDILSTKEFMRIRNKLWPLIWADGDLARSQERFRQVFVETREIANSQNRKALARKSPYPLGISGNFR